MSSSFIKIRNPALTHVQELDGVRGIAILLVLLVHTFYRGPLINNDLFKSPLSNFFIFGWTGVELFFVLSGFLITHIVIQSIKSHSPLTSFYTRRFGRIVPLYFLLVIIISSLALFNISPKIDAVSASAVRNLPLYLTFTQNLANLFGRDLANAAKALGPLWSVALEQQYYLIWPPCLYYLGVKRALWIACLLIAASLILRIVLCGHFDNDIFYFSPVFHTDGLFIGSLAAVLALSVNLKKQWLFLYILLALLGMSLLFWLAGGINYTIPLIQTYGLTVVPLFYAGIVLLASSEAYAPRILSNPVLKAFGKYSYAIYLLHWPILLIGSQINFGSGIIAFCLFFVGFSCLNMALAKIIWIVFEGPLNRFFRNIARKIDDSVPSPAPKAT